MKMLLASCRWLIGSGLLVVSLVCAAQTAEPNFIAVSDVLFPQARSWPVVADAPVLPTAQFKQLKGTLEKAYKAATASSAFLEGRDCSFIDRALESSEAPSFHSLDINRDGVADIVYVGSAQCAEGSATVVWYGTANGYFVRQPAAFSQRVLRVSPDGHNTTSVNEGCCGAPTDEYYLGSLRNLRQGGGLSILKETTLPSHRLDRALSFKATRELKLRWNAKTLDAYDPGRSEFLGHAAFGNVVRIYLPNSKGIALASANENGKKWFFVAMEAESDVLASHDPYAGVRAGWIQADNSLVFEP